MGFVWSSACLAGLALAWLGLGYAFVGFVCFVVCVGAYLWRKVIWFMPYSVCEKCRCIRRLDKVICDCGLCVGYVELKKL